jgi:hypothetical protein
MGLSDRGDRPRQQRAQRASEGLSNQGNGGNTMKRIVIISTVTALFLVLGVAVQLGAQGGQEGQHEKQGKPEKQQGQAKGQQGRQQQGQAKGQQGQQQHQRQAQQQQSAQQQRLPQSDRPEQRQVRPQQTYGGGYHGGVQPNAPVYGGVHASGVPQRQTQVHSGFGQSRAHAWNDDHRSWGQRGGYNGYRIPEDRFRLYFGNNHRFRIYGLPLVFVGGYPRFQYDGYWVTFVDPWPEMWPDTWYQTDDVYLDYTNDGYYIYNRSRPGLAIAVTVSF